MRFTASLIVAFLSAGFFFASAGAAPPVEAFGDLPQAVLARLSPDGRHLAVIRPLDGRAKVQFLDLSKPDSKPLVAELPGAIASDVYWKGNDRAVAIFHATFTPKNRGDVIDWSRALGITLSAGTTALLMHNTPNFKSNRDAGSIADLADGDPDHVYMTEIKAWDHQNILDLFRVDLATGKAEIVRHGGPKTVAFITDGRGHVLGTIERDADLTTRVLVDRNAAFTYSARGGADFKLVGLTMDGGMKFVVQRPSKFGTQGLYAWDGKSATFGPPLFENPDYDVSGILYDERNGDVIGCTYVDDMPRTRYFDPALQRIQDSLEHAYPGQSVAILSKDDARTSYVILTQGPRNPPVLSLFTTGNHQVNVIEEAYPGLKASDLGETKPYPYSAPDGLGIRAYLTLPPGSAGRNLPLVVFPHGGPEARDALGFDWWAQFMASRGYAVFQPNFRGSSGYGGKFVKAGDGEWAGKVQDDVQAGVRKLIADGIVDPKRICIVGASYGGYMALAGATFSPDLYACAVSYAGISDLKRLLYTGTMFESESISVWNRRAGIDVDSGKAVALSPANFADRVTIPVLLIHGDKDTTVPIAQSEVEERALKDAGKPVEFVKLEGDDHYLEYAPTRIQLLKEIERFLEANIGH